MSRVYGSSNESEYVEERSSQTEDEDDEETEEYRIASSRNHKAHPSRSHPRQHPLKRERRVTSEHLQYAVPPGSKRRKSLGKSMPLKLERFDVSTLLPLTQVEKPSRKLKIELICKLTGEVHVCFAHEYAAQALNVDPSVVHEACRSFGSDPPYFNKDLPFCQLRYVEKSTAYEYGTNARDFCSCAETHEERLERWTKLQEVTETYHQAPGDAKLAKGPFSGSDEVSRHSKNDSDLFSSNRKLVPGHVYESSALLEKNKGHVAMTRGGRVLGKIDSTLKALREEKRKAVISILQGATLADEFWPERHKMRFCLACQAKTACIIFEPCYHRALCPECARNWCPHTCPLCYVPIKRRLQPADCISVRPRVHSKYSSIK